MSERTIEKGRRQQGVPSPLSDATPAPPPTAEATPAPRSTAEGTPAPRSTADATPAPRSTAVRRTARLHPDDAEGSVVAVLGGTTRKGSWEPPARLRVFAFMGGVELDFREADFLEGETIVEVFTCMGGVNVVVPPDVDVRASGTGILGGFTGLAHQAREADAPLLRIEGLALMGGVEVKIKKLPLKKRLRTG